MNNKTILLIDDDPSLLRVTEYQLESAEYKIITAVNGKDGLTAYRKYKPDLVLTDIKMPVMDGMELLTEIKRICPHALVILVTAHGSIETAIQAMKTGAFDYICKPFDKDELLITVKKALDYQHIVNENLHLREELLSTFRFENIVAGSEAMSKVFKMIRRVSQADSSVLLQGESGTGKELIARAIHYSSPRQNHPFIAVNCAAIPDTLIESEFFGHVKGAFTGAINERTGKFEQANHGTIFLDEIGDMRLELQSKLLRVLQEHEFEKVGGTKPIPVDVRVIAATNNNLKKMVDEKRFREDLYYRLNVVPIRLPSLRERKDDIPLLIQHFLRELGGGRIKVASEVYDQLQMYDWPGNVRELQNIIEQTFVLRQHDDQIRLEDVPDFLIDKNAASSKPLIEIPPQGIILDDVEKDLIHLALKKTNNNQNQASKLLGITRQTLIYRMKKYGI